jgi:uncharacterized membrane protein
VFFDPREISLKWYFAATTLFCVLILFILSEPVFGQISTAYTIQVVNDGSAVWIITRTGTQLQSSIDTLIDFRNRVDSLVDSARNATRRDMAVNEDEFSLSSNFSGSYVTVEYRFSWLNFSKIESNQMVIGDVFQTRGFFDQLYGDGPVSMTYSSDYAVQQASPTPYQRNDSLHTLTWLGTTDLLANQTLITLVKQSSTPDFMDVFDRYVAIILSAVVAVAAVLVIYSIFTRRKKGKTKDVAHLGEPSFPQIESDEEKVLKLLKAAGGNMYQSAIAEQCKFSRAKASQLLADLEARGKVRRQKMGREKMVVLFEQDKKAEG